MKILMVLTSHDVPFGAIFEKRASCVSDSNL
jgi:hypothetical protein